MLAARPVGMPLSRNVTLYGEVVYRDPLDTATHKASAKSAKMFAGNAIKYLSRFAHPTGRSYFKMLDRFLAHYLQVNAEYCFYDAKSHMLQLQQRKLSRAKVDLKQPSRC